MNLFEFREELYVKIQNLPVMQETPIDSWVRKIRWRRDRLPTPVFLGFPGGSAGKESESHPVMSNSLRLHGLYSPLNSPGQNTGVGSLSLLQGLFPTQGWNPGLPHCRRILYQLSHKGSPRILEWVAYPFSSGSSWPRNQSGSPALQADSEFLHIILL